MARSANSKLNRKYRSTVWEKERKRRKQSALRREEQGWAARSGPVFIVRPADDTG